MPADSERLMDSLEGRPRLFGAERVERLETHISWVLLAGECAWKFKKPVNFGFLDFSTLERRRFFCEEELRLNRRLAPRLYLDVVPITGTVDEPGIGGEGTPIEYAVKMRRFSQESLLSRALPDGRLQSEHIDRLAREVAVFHESIPPAAATSPYGSSEGVWAPLAENFRQLARVGGDASHAATVAGIEEWCRSEHAARRPLFEQRRQRGFIRECHGDMHLGNMILEQDGSVTIFDGIEFSESLRWIDVASEMAFLTMDLEDRGRPDFAHRCLNAYLELTGDYDALGVLPFYLVYRATVRAKVASLRLQQEGIDAPEHERQRHHLRSYLELAERSTRPPRPFLVITSGVSGTGKTFGTQPIVEQFGAVRIRSDVERKRLFGLKPLDRSGSGLGTGLYTREASQRTYEQLRMLTRAGLAAGRPIIADATFLRRSSRDEFRRIAEDAGVPFVILSFDAPESVLRDRVRRREQHERDASEATLAVLDQQLRHREPLEESERADAVEIDTTRTDTGDKMIARVRKLIQAMPRGQ